MFVTEEHGRGGRIELHLRLVWQHRCIDRVIYELVPLHRARVRYRNQPLLLPRQILRSRVGRFAGEDPIRFLSEIYTTDSTQGGTKVHDELPISFAHDLNIRGSSNIVTAAIGSQEMYL